MSKVSIPLRVDPRKMADRAAVLEDEIPLSSFARLTEALEDVQGQVHLRISFGRDEQRTVVAYSELDVVVKMVCQRCLDVVELPIHSASEYAIVNPEASTQHLPKSYDVLEVGEDPLDLLALVEDELLLALPIVPLHASEDCQMLGSQDAEPEGKDESSPASSPFSILAQLKRDSKV